MLEIKSISIGGFANIDKVSINDTQTVPCAAAMTPMCLNMPSIPW